MLPSVFDHIVGIKSSLPYIICSSVPYHAIRSNYSIRMNMLPSVFDHTIRIILSLQTIFLYHLYENITIRISCPFHFIPPDIFSSSIQICYHPYLNISSISNSHSISTCYVIRMNKPSSASQYSL